MKNSEKSFTSFWPNYNNARQMHKQDKTNRWSVGEYFTVK